MHRFSTQEGSKRVLHLATRHPLVLLVLIASVTGAIMVATFASLSSSHTPGFVEVCGTQLCLNGQVWQLHGGSANGATPDANARMDMAVQGHLNTVRLTDYLHGDAYDENQWKAVDEMIATAHTHGVHILLDLSTYGGVVARKTSSTAFFAYDWNPFLTFVLNRTNTITGIQYKNDSTIAVIGLLGEIGPGNNPQDVISFFKLTAAEFKALDHHHVLEPGGLYQMWQGSGIDYQTIFALPDIDICAVHAPAQFGQWNDASTTAQTCQALGKPWIWEEFSQPQGIGDQQRANWFQDVYTNAKRLHAAGASFWNLGPGLGAENDDVGPQTPITWQTVINNAPAQSLLPPTGIGTPTSTPLPGGQTQLAVLRSLTLDTTTLSSGQFLTAQITYKNESTAPVRIQAIGINGVPPGGTRTQGPWLNFTPGQGALTLQSEQTITVTASQTFTRSDPVGNWFAYATYQDANGTWHDDVSTAPFTVTDSNS